jgi:ornithine cyclodeaminase/alanine dehydrogenase-like protein (mu-crystallin family)
VTRQIRFLSGQVVREILTWEETIRIQGEAFALLSGGRIQMPVKTLLLTDRPKAHMLFMPALLEDAGGFGVKFTGRFPENVEKGHPPRM